MTYLDGTQYIDDGEISELWECQCGGDVQLTAFSSTDASATEVYECQECGDSGEVHNAPGPEYPKTRGSVVPS